MFYQRKQVKRIKTTKFRAVSFAFNKNSNQTWWSLNLQVVSVRSIVTRPVTQDKNRLWDAACRYHGNGASYLNGISGREWGWLRGETSSLGRSRRKSWLHHLTSKALDNDRHKGGQTKQFLIFSFSFRPVQGFVFKAKFSPALLPFLLEIRASPVPAV